MVTNCRVKRIRCKSGHVRQRLETKVPEDPLRKTRPGHRALHQHSHGSGELVEHTTTVFFGL